MVKQLTNLTHDATIIVINDNIIFILSLTLLTC